VGKAFTHAIERWEIEHRGDEDIATSRTVWPHMRRAPCTPLLDRRGRKVAAVNPATLFVFAVVVIEETAETQVALLR
jgi:hypothetical protein